MNHIYKVIFNKATGTFMAVAEYAKSHSGGSSSSTAGQVGSSPVIRLTRVATLAILAIAAMVNSTIPAAAAGGVAVSQDHNNNDDARKARADGDYAVAVGQSSHAKGAQSIAIGGGDGSMGKKDKAGAKAEGDESIAIGGDVNAKGKASIAIGSDDLYITDKNGQSVDQALLTLINKHPELKTIRSSSDNSVKFQRTQATGHASIAAGTMSKASGHFANAFGTRAEAEGAFSVAVGLTSRAKGESSVALGSAAKAENKQAIAIGAQANAAGIDSIAIGGDNANTTEVGNKQTSGRANSENYKDIVGTYLNNNNSNNKYTKSNDGAIAIGTQAYGEGVWSNALGVRAKSQGFGSTAIGTGSWAYGGSSVALGLGAKATDNRSVAIGAGSVASGMGAAPTNSQAYNPSTNSTLNSAHQGTNSYGVVSVGRDADGSTTAIKRRITNVGAGASDTDAVNVAQLKEAVKIAKRKTKVEAAANDSNITVNNSTVNNDENVGTKYTVQLAKTLNNLDAVNTKNLTASEKVTVTNNNNTAELQNSGLTFSKTGNLPATNGKTVYSVDGLKFTDSSNTATVGSTRITDEKIGFAKADGTVDTDAPYLDKKQLKVGTVKIDKDSGIDAGNQTIKNVQSTLMDTANTGTTRTLEQGNTIDNDPTKKSNAASIKDVLNAGFNLQSNGNSIDFVSSYDTINFADGEGTTAKVAYSNDGNKPTNKVVYDVNVDNKTIHLANGNGNGKKNLSVKTTTLTKKDGTNGNATTFSTTDDNALVTAKGIQDNLNALATEINTTKNAALQTFTVKKDGDNTNAITVGQNVNGNNAVSTLKLKGENGLTVATNKDGTVTFGINTQSGLKAGDSTTLNKDGLSIKNPTGNEQIQVGTDGIKFAKVDDKGAAGAAGAGIDGTSRITKDQIGFANSTGQVDINKPHLSKDGINAGGKKITNIQAGEIAKNSHDAVTGGQIYDLETELKNKISSTAKTAQNSLHEFSVADEHGNNFTVSNPYSSYDTSKTSDVITFAGENGITTKVNKGVVRVGIDQTKGLTTPKLTVGNNNGKGIVIDSQNGQNTITGLSNTLANVTNDGAGHALSQGLADNTDKTRAASIGDVLNAGFNLQGNGTAVDFVSTYDTVNFANGNTTTAKVTYDDTSKTSKVVYDVNVDDTTIEVKDKKLGVKTTTLTSTGTGANKFALSNQATGDALVKASDIVAHLNTLSGDIQTAKGASQANNSAGYVDADGNKVIYDSTDNKYYQAKNDGTVDKTKEVAKDKLVAQAQTPDGTLAQMNVKSVINKEQVNDANKKQGINEDNAFVKGLEKAASDNKTKNAAVTVGDLNAVAQTPLTFAGDTGTTAKKLGETLTIKGGQTDTNKLTDNNIGVVAGTDGFTVKLAKDLTNLNSVNAGGTKIDDKGVSFVDSSGQAKANTPVLSANGLDLGGKVISNVGKGTKDTDAANVQQLNEVRNLLGLGNAGNDNADGNQVNIADIKKDPNSGSSSNRTVIKAGTVLGGKGNNDTEKLATGGVQVGVDKDGNANGDLSNVWVKTQKDGSKKALLATYNAAGQTNYLTNNPAEAIDRINEQGIRFFHVNDGNQEPVVQGRNGIDSSASGKHSVAIGFQAKADGEAAVAIGRQTQAGNQSIAIGDNAQATGDQSIAIGTGNVVAGKHSGAIGDPSTVKADNSYSVGNNNQFTDATQTDVFGVGNNITVTESNSVALGSNSAISAGTQAKKSDGTAGTTTTAGATGTVKGFAGQTAVGAVSVGASGAERRIQNVAAGEVSATSTDAVNGSQLYKATQGIANATNELDHRIHQNENKANAGISSAMAMASMPQAYIPGRSMVTGGIATHNGQGAVAVGLSKLSDNGQWVFKINGSADTQGHVGAAVGAGFHF